VKTVNFMIADRSWIVVARNVSVTRTLRREEGRRQPLALWSSRPSRTNRPVPSHSTRNSPKCTVVRHSQDLTPLGSALSGASGSCQILGTRSGGPDSASRGKNLE
jgi:hypothetical protein